MPAAAAAAASAPLKAAASAFASAACTVSAGMVVNASRVSPRCAWKSTSVGLGSGGSFTWTRFSARSVDRRPLTGLPVSAATAAFAAIRISILGGGLGRLHVGGRIDDLHALGHEAGRTSGLLAMDGSPFGARGQLGLAHPSAAHPARHVEQHGDARGVAVRGLVVGGELVRGRLQNRQRHENQHDGHEHVEHDLGGAGGMEEQRRPQDEQQRTATIAPEVHPAKHRQRRQERLLQLGAHLAAVVTGHENDLAAARAARLGRVAGLVLRHDVLADPARRRPWTAPDGRAPRQPAATGRSRDTMRGPGWP